MPFPLEDLEAMVARSVAEVMAHRERYVKAWVAETGLLPSECEMVEEQHYGEDRVTTTITVRRRGTR